MAITYNKIATNTISVSAASVTFSSIPAIYTDLVLVCAARETVNTGGGLFIQFNGDTAANYSNLYLYGDGTSAVSGRTGSQTKASIGNMAGTGTTTTEFPLSIVSIQNYTSTTAYKSTLSRSNPVAAGLVIAYANAWRATPAAINSITLSAGTNLYAGSSFTLYGIKAA